MNDYLYKVAELKLIIDNSIPISVDYRRAVATNCGDNSWEKYIFVAKTEEQALEYVSTMFVDKLRQQASKTGAEHIMNEFKNTHVNVTLFRQGVNELGCVEIGGFNEKTMTTTLTYITI